ncbi:MAG: hypothetical protein OXI30_15400 [Chloroflexota bacterium]|nr:hypothetical protein [Chloroflexota bacterium]
MGANCGWWCNSKTIPITCKHCGDRIFWYSCDCGSSVLFDELGPPWPKHRCRGSHGSKLSKKKAKRLQQKKRKIVDNLRFLEILRWPDGLNKKDRKKQKKLRKRLKKLNKRMGIEQG